MNYKLIVRPEAESDISEAYSWYEKYSKGLGSNFVHAVDESISSIQRNPESYQKIHKHIRRVLVHRFPYGIFYLLEWEAIVVIAVFHARRAPKQWHRRLKNA